MERPYTARLRAAPITPDVGESVAERVFVPRALSFNFLHL